MIIRINLHPNKKPKKKSNPGLMFVAIGIALLVFFVFVGFVTSSVTKNETKGVNSQIASVQAEIDKLNEDMKDADAIRNQIQELNNRQYVLARLTSVRIGPQYVMNEISRLLSNPRDVIARKEATEQGWLLAWEPENVMVNSIKDTGNGMIDIKGIARTMDDIQEFWTRMKTSPLLRNIELVEIRENTQSGLGEVTQQFTFTANANFNYQTAEGRAYIDALTQSDESEASAPEGAAEAAGEPSGE